MDDKKGVDFFTADEKATFDLNDLDEETAQKSGIRFTRGRSFSYKDDKRVRWYKFPIYAICLFAYLLMGIIWQSAWAWGWIVFFAVPLYYTFVSAVIHKKAVIFAYPVLVAAAFLLGGMVWNMWGALWVLFLTIPFYYWLATGNTKKFWKKFPYSALCLVVYIVLGITLSLWLKGLLIFLTIPIFDGIVSMFYK